MKTTIKNCQSCGAVFSARKVNAKYCCQACKQSAYYVRLNTIKNNHEQERARLFEGVNHYKTVLENQNKAREAEYKLLIERQNSKLVEVKNQYKIEEETRTLNNAKDLLRGWIKSIIEFSELEEVSCLRLRSAFIRIHEKIEWELKHLPENFSYKNFIGYTLKPCLAIWSHEAENNENRWIHFSLPDEIRSDFTAILKDLG